MDVATVIPAYNPDPGYLAELFECLAAQTVQPAEVVVVDDGSAVPVGAPYRVVRQPNGGVSDARNRGVREATAAIVHVLDQDELLEPTFYERLLPAFADPGVGVASGVMRGLVDGQPADWTLPPLDYRLPAAPLRDLLLENRIGSSGAIFRRSVWEMVGGFGDYRWVQDWHFWLRAAQVTRIVQVPEVLAWHRRHAAQTTDVRTERQMHAEEVRMLQAVPVPWRLRPVRARSVAVRRLQAASGESARARWRAAMLALPFAPRSAIQLGHSGAGNSV